MTPKILLSCLLYGLLFTKSVCIPTFAAQQTELNKQVIQERIQIHTQWLENSPVNAEINFSQKYPETQWWIRFNDPTLTQLIQTALAENQDIAIANARLKETHALARLTESAQYPSLTVGVTDTRQKNIYNSNAGSSSSGTTGSGGSQIFAPNTVSTVYSTPLRVNYEPDIWLINRDRSRVKIELARASEYELHASQLSIASDVATAYFNHTEAIALVDMFQRAEDIARADELAAQDKLDLGLLSEDVLSQKQNQLAQIQAQRAGLQNLKEITQHQLAVLTGETPEAFTLPSPSSFEAIQLPQTFNTGSPADIFSHRPDILAKEHELEAARIDVNVARKSFLPTFNLSGQLGYTDITVGSFTLQSLAWNAIASMTQSIFKGGALRAGLKVTKAKQEQALHQYKKNILLAAQEVDDALSGLNAATKQYQHYQEAVNSIAKQDELQQIRIEAGAASPSEGYPQTLQTLQAQLQAAQGKLAVLTQTISLYKALGGGF